jgi:hypothetical protein
MAQQSPDRGSGWDPRGWSTGKIIVLVLALAAFVVMLTWERGHFPGEQPAPGKAGEVGAARTG